MKITIKNNIEEDFPCDVLILPFAEGGSNPYEKFGRQVCGLISRVFNKEFKGSSNEVFLVPAPEDMKPERILFLGIGNADSLTAEKIRQSGGKALSYLRDMGMKKISLSVQLLESLKQDPADFIEGALLGLYTYDRYKKTGKKGPVDSIVVLSRSDRYLERRIRYVQAVAESVAFARDLINTPANDMTPSDLAHAASGLKRKNVSVKVLDRAAVSKLGMGSYLAVSHGSKQPPRFVVIEYKGSKNRPVVLVGKSITFDSGGLSLKPSDGMEKMKYDMAGGAAVLGVIRAAADLRLPVNLAGLLPAAENLPGGAATRPGDVVRSISGKTIEIANTDAEGRLALADAIEYAKRFKPSAIVDIATLTGACAIAFGGEMSAMMGNDRKLLDALKTAGDRTYERVCELPLYEEYKEYLKSDIADIRNIGNRIGSLMASAYFLHEFAGDTPWVHIDIAGTAWVDKDRPYIPKGASGIGVRLILDYIKGLK